MTGMDRARTAVGTAKGPTAPGRNRLAGWLSLVAGAVLVLGSLSLAGVIPTPPAAAATCPANAVCIAMPSGGGMVEAQPVTDLPSSGWVNLTFTGFPDFTRLYIAYCSNLTPLTTASPLCATTKSSEFLFSPATIYTDASGTAHYTQQVITASGSDTISGTVPGDSSSKPTNFNCDAGTAPANPCSIDVVESALDGGNNEPVPANTAQVPVTFNGNGGCTHATPVYTNSEFGIEQLLPVAGTLGCTQSNPAAIALDSADDGLTAVDTLADGGNVTVAFTDDPESADEQQALHCLPAGTYPSSCGNYKLIPVALSANVIGFRAETGALLGGSSTEFEQVALDLTPTEVAGFMSSAWTNADSTDLVSCPKSGTNWCTEDDPNVCAGNQCSVFAELNQQAGDVYSNPSYAAYVRSDSSGLTDQLLTWLCNAPNTPVKMPDGAEAKEPIAASDELLFDLNAFLPGNQLKACPSGDDTFPSLTVPDPSQFGEDAQPAAQLKSLANWWLPPGVATSSEDAFTSMNWAEALVNGLDVASLQNAGGVFVQPTQTSLDAAVADASTNQDGSLTFSYANTDPAAYPMPDVIYAVVSGNQVTAAQATAEQSMLNQLLKVSGGSEDTSLPAGFVPLPSSLYNAAVTDVQNDIVAAPSPTTTTTTTTATTTPASSGSGSGGDTGSDTGLDSGLDAFGGSGSLGFPGASVSNFTPGSVFAGTTGLGDVTGGQVTGNPTGATDQGGGSALHRVAAAEQLPRAFLLEASDDRLLLPSVVILGLLALLWGLLLLSPRTRRAVLAAGGSAKAVVGRILPSKGAAGP